MRHITRTFLAGLASVLPVVATLYLVYWLASSAESILGAGLRLVLSDRFYWPGLGVALGAAIIFAVGLLMHTWLARTIFSWWERLLYRLPLIKSIYGAFRDLLSFVAAPRDKALQQVVAVRIGETDMRLLGFVTRDDLQDLPKGLAEADAADAPALAERIAALLGESLEGIRVFFQHELGQSVHQYSLRFGRALARRDGPHQVQVLGLSRQWQPVVFAGGLPVGDQQVRCALEHLRGDAAAEMRTSPPD